RDFSEIARAADGHSRVAREIERVVPPELIIIHPSAALQTNESRLPIFGIERQRLAIEHDPTVVQMTRGGRAGLDRDVPTAMARRVANDAGRGIEWGELHAHFFVTSTVTRSSFRSTRPSMTWSSATPRNVLSRTTTFRIG